MGHGLQSCVKPLKVSGSFSEHPEALRQLNLASEADEHFFSMAQCSAIVLQIMFGMLKLQDDS